MYNYVFGKKLKYNIFKITFLLISIQLFLGKCNMNEDNFINDLRIEDHAKWDVLTQKKIYFGHQSVGYNIVDGMEELILNLPDVKFSLCDLEKCDEVDKNNFLHSKIGQNKEPQSKINDFKRKMMRFTDSLDIACFKFCYIDITEKTDISSIFKYYKETMSSLENQFPNTRIIHFTVPLRTVPKGLKIWLMKLLGKNIWGYDQNIIRHKFNNMMRKEYQQKGILFDLAHIESKCANGKINGFKKNGSFYPSLIPEFSDDGGHLNSFGRKKVASQFLKFLLDLQYN